MISLRSRSFGNAALRLNRLSSFRSQIRGSSAALRAAALNALTRATEEVAINLLPPVPPGTIIRLRHVGTPANGTLVREGGTVRYRSNRLFLGREQIAYELSDLYGMVTRSTVSIDVAPHPAIGVPFDDGFFFDDETGWDLT